ncbi:MAG: CHASE2 domain-containing protein [Muribaculaceae bacterium]|nr:CHASE2 domain-containing protein [Muribaculaceae bacterium]
MRRLGTERFRSLMDGLPLPVKATVVTLMALLFSHMVIYDLMSVSFFSPMEKAADFRFSDFYTIVANERAEKGLDSDVVLVGLDGCDRREMARVIDDIDYCAPAAVGLDIAFTPPPDPDDDPLAEALANCDNLVMPVMANDEGRVVHLSHYDSIVDPSGGFAAVNIQGTSGALATVREFTKGFVADDGETVPALPVALVGLAKPESVAALERRKHSVEAISYVSREFETFRPDELLDNEDAIRGRIVLVGKLHDAGDLHVTPTDNFTPGLRIHAYTTATILSGDYTRRLTPYETYLLAGVLTMLLVWLNMWLDQTPLRAIWVRLVQLALLYLMIVVGTIVFIRFNVDLNFAYPMLAISLGVAMCDIYDGIFKEEGLVDCIGRYIQKKYLTRYGHEENTLSDSFDAAGGDNVAHHA